MLLHDAFIHQVSVHPQKVAVKTDEGVLTYSELHDKSHRLAAYLLQKGLQKGDRVVLYMTNSLALCVSIYGVLLAGGAFVVVNPTTKKEKLWYIVSNCTAFAIITHQKLIPDSQELSENVPSLRLLLYDQRNSQAKSLEELVREPLAEVRWPRIISVDLAALVYTSGSTGNPKGVTLTHLNMVSAAQSIITYLQNKPDDIVLNVLPLSFDYGLYQLLMVLTFGGTLILERDFLYPSEIISKLQAEKVTGFPGVPTIFALLFKMQELSTKSFPHLRYISNTGAALPEEFIKKLLELFPSAQVFSMYGLTECKRVAYLPPADIRRKPGSVGVAMPNCEVFILDDDLEPVKPGKAGELYVRGANVMQGYWNMPEETAKVLLPGRYPFEKVLRTGDIFKMDEEGYLYFLGRKDDMIKSRGEKVSPKEVENVLYQMEGIEEAVVIGVKDEILGQAIKAYIKTAPYRQIAGKEVIRHCAKYLENFCVPQIVEFVDSLPKSPNGKIDRRSILEASLS
ncbi:MAG TPA: AMP-binding protein [bacterium]|nr:AMP-binding protein [bacterium]HNT64686.1 AMP-binding protein [bacterium]